MNPADPYGLVGQVLDGQFRVDKLVGEGGFSTVYRGHNVGLNEPVALKCLKLPAAIGTALVDTFIQRFRDESRILYRLSQGNLHIVRSLGAGTTQSPVTGALIPYMALEWLEGRSVAAEFQVRRTTGKRGRPLDEVLRLFDTAADALGFAHSQGVVHRDLNPGNLFLTSGPSGQTMKVLDFGVAKIMDDSLGLGPRQQTMGQFRIFAPAYGSPEQFDDRIGAVSAASDVYAFALILIESLRDHAVNEGQHLGEFARLATDPARRPTPRFFGIEVPDEVEKAFERATTLDPKERWQTATEFWKALTGAHGFATERRYEEAARETPALAPTGKKQSTLNMDLKKTMPLSTSGFAPPPKPGASVPRTAPTAKPLGTKDLAKTEPFPDKSAAVKSALATTAKNEDVDTKDAADTEPPSPPDDDANESTVVVPPPAPAVLAAATAPAKPSQANAPDRTVALNDPAAIKARDEAMARARAATAPRPASSPIAPPKPAARTLALGAMSPADLPKPRPAAGAPAKPPPAIASESDIEDDPDAMFGDDDADEATKAQPPPVKREEKREEAKEEKKDEEPPPSGRTLVMAAPVRPPQSQLPAPPPPAPVPPSPEPPRGLGGTMMLGVPPPPMQAPQPFGPQSPYAAPTQPSAQLPQPVPPTSPFARSAAMVQQPGQSMVHGGQSQPVWDRPTVAAGGQGSQLVPPQPFMPSPYAPRPSDQQQGAPSVVPQAPGSQQWAAAPGAEPPKKSPLLVAGAALGAVAILLIGISLVFVSRKPQPIDLASASAMPSADVPPPVTAATSAAPPVTATVATTTDAAAVELEDDASAASADAGVDAKATAEDAATTAPATTTTTQAVATTQAPTTPVVAPPVTPSAKPSADPNAWNEGNARSRLNAANNVLVICKKDGAVGGPGNATVTFAPDGSVSNATVDPPYAGTKEGDCALAQFRRVKVNAFNGGPQTLRHSFEVPK